MDFQGIIHRLRPDAPYLLKDGGGELYADILEWQDENTTQPTEAECTAEWDVMLAERADKLLVVARREKAIEVLESSNFAGAKSAINALSINEAHKKVLRKLARLEWANAVITLNILEDDPGE